MINVTAINNGHMYMYDYVQDENMVINIYQRKV